MFITMAERSGTVGRHSSFGTYTHRIGKAANENCRYCGERDSPAHAIFECARELETRRRVEIEIGGDFDQGLVIGSMCRSKRVWGEYIAFSTEWASPGELLFTSSRLVGTIMDNNSNEKEKEKDIWITEGENDGGNAMAIGAEDGNDTSQAKSGHKDEAQPNPFARRARLSRSPTMQRGRTVSLSELQIIEIAEGDTKRGSKRRALGSREMDARTPEEDIVSKLLKQVRHLGKFCKENVNVHREIKKLASELNLTALSCVDVDRRNKRALADTEKEWDTLKEVQCRMWPNKIFRSAVIEVGSPKGPGKEADELMIYEHDSVDGPNTGIRRAYENRYYELRNFEGRFNQIKIRTSVVGAGGEPAPTGTERSIYRAEIGGPEDWFEVLTKVRERILIDGRVKLTLFPPADDKYRKLTRKMAEVIFRNTSIKCIIYVKEPSDGMGSKNSDKERGSRIEETEALIVEKDGDSYAEALKMVRRSVKADIKAANAIRYIRKSKDGKMIILLDKTEPALLKEVRRNIEAGTQFKTKEGSRRKGKPCTLYVRDLDEITSKEEVEEALKKTVGLDAGKDIFKIGDLRPYRSGNQAVTIQLPGDKAKELLSTGRIKIGLNWCQIQERIDECKSDTDLSEACRKCSKSGHREAECDQEAFCPLCKKLGHSVNAGKCSAFQRALDEEKSKRKGKSNVGKGEPQEEANQTQSGTNSITPQRCTDEMKTAFHRSTVSNRRDITEVPYWWSDNIAEARRTCTAARRAVLRASSDPEETRQQKLEFYKEKKTVMRRPIRAAKREAWKLDEDIWSDGYRLVKQQFQ
ncbi:hypothetical protein NQ315_012921 [Exocentrus adspersus]|uniref:CCHC-type domain-containing protein n=1 Tax=Exocentrus adspersus TaxID=1586481 RepID=A0AAV8VRZ1_9CUCU|nr:hypothetical protein NQ315_012921 [Exocentrus adspersus]